MRSADKKNDNITVFLNTVFALAFPQVCVHMCFVYPALTADPILVKLPTSISELAYSASIQKRQLPCN